MNIRRIIFWLSFVVVLGLIIWGLIVAMGKESIGPRLGTPTDVTESDNILGNPAAPVTILEYSDFECPACAQYHSLLKRLLDEASSTVRIVYRHFPLDNLLPTGEIQHPRAVPAALASQAAANQGKFAEMHDLLFENQYEWASLPVSEAVSVFEGYAATIGLDMARFRADRDSQESKAFVNAQKDESIRLGLNYTPTFFINGKAINNPTSYDEFKSVIESAAQSVSP